LIEIVLCAISENNFKISSAGEPDCCCREDARAFAALAGVEPGVRDDRLAAAAG
jgi:hypothetical protein